MTTDIIPAAPGGTPAWLDILSRAGPLLYGPRWQAPLSGALGLHPGAIGSWLAGRRRPHAALLPQLRRLLLDRAAAIHATQVTAPLDSDSLAFAASLLYGREWQTPLAADYGTVASNVRRWAADPARKSHRRCPPALAAWLAARLPERRQALLDLVAEIDGRRTPTPLTSKRKGAPRTPQNQK